MVPEDIKYIQRLIDADVLAGPVLELGTGYGGDTSRRVIEAAGLQYFGTDMMPGPNVDFVADFDRSDDMGTFRDVAPFDTVLILNVLEHTFDPIRILDNAIKLIRPGGRAVLLTPAIWPLHGFPIDVWRPLPNFYEEYASRRGLKLVDDYFEFVGYGRVSRFRNGAGEYSFPPPSRSAGHRLASRAVHKLFNTFGRSMFHPSHVAIGAVIQVV